MTNRQVANCAKRRELFDAQEAIDSPRDDLIGMIERQLKNTHDVKSLPLVFGYDGRLC